MGRLPPGEAARAGAQASSCLWERAWGAGMRGDPFSLGVEVLSDLTRSLGQARRYCLEIVC